MSLLFQFIRTWNKWYRVLRNRKDSGGWIPYAMACGWRIADWQVLS